MKGSIYKVIGTDNRGRTKYTYRVVYRFIDPKTGQRRRTSKRGFKTKLEAKEFLEHLESENLKNSIIPSESFQSLRRYLEFWLETIVAHRVKPTTAFDYKRIVDTYILPYIGDILIKDISGATLDSMFQSLQIHGNIRSKKSLAPRTLLYAKRILHKAFADAVKRGYLEKNPCDYMLFEIKAERFKPDTYSKDEILQLISMSKNTSMGVPIALAVICGLRRGEVLAVTPSDLNFENRIISISKQVVEIDGKVQLAPPKTESSRRTVFMPDFLARLLQVAMNLNRKMFDETEKVFNSSPILRDEAGGFLRPRNLSNRYSRFLKAKHLRHIRFHDLRHSYASLLYESGVPLKTTSELLGHSSIEITADIYTHLNERTKNRVAEQLCNSIFNEEKS